MNNRRGRSNTNNLLAQAMTGNRNVSLNEASVSGADLAKIRQNIASTKQTGRKTNTDLVLEISRLQPDQRSSDLIHSRITDFFHANGASSLNKWQINSVVRHVMAQRLSVTHDDLIELEKQIRLKETGLPGSKRSPLSTKKVSPETHYKKVEIRPSAMKASNSRLQPIVGSHSPPLAAQAPRQ